MNPDAPVTSSLLTKKAGPQTAELFDRLRIIVCTANIEPVSTERPHVHLAIRSEQLVHQIVKPVLSTFRNETQYVAADHVHAHAHLITRCRLFLEITQHPIRRSENAVIDLMLAYIRRDREQGVVAAMSVEERREIEIRENVAVHHQEM